MLHDIEIIIIDDDREIIEALTEMLELEEFRVKGFLSPEKALLTLAKNSP